MSAGETRRATVFVLYAEEDEKPHFEELTKHFKALAKHSKEHQSITITVFGQHGQPATAGTDALLGAPGSAKESYWTEVLSSPEPPLVLWLCSPESIVDESVERLLEQARQRKLRIVPIDVKPNYHQKVSGVLRLPRNGPAVSLWSSTDAAWVAVVAEILPFLVPAPTTRSSAESAAPPPVSPPTPPQEENRSPAPAKSARTPGPGHGRPSARLLKRLVSEYRAASSWFSAAVIGRAGSGRTWALRGLAEELRTGVNPTPICCYLDAAEKMGEEYAIKAPDDFWRWLAGAIADQALALGIHGAETLAEGSDSPDRLKRITEFLMETNRQRHRLVLILDNYDDWYRRPQDFDRRFFNILHNLASTSQLTLVFSTEDPLKTMDGLLKDAYGPVRGASSIHLKFPKPYNYPWL